MTQGGGLRLALGYYLSPHSGLKTEMPPVRGSERKKGRCHNDPGLTLLGYYRPSRWGTDRTVCCSVVPEIAEWIEGGDCDIDRLVNELDDLTEEEIAIVEGSTASATSE